MERGRKPKEGEGYERDKRLEMRISESDLAYIDSVVKDLNQWEDKPLTRTDVILKAIRNYEW